MLGVPHAPLGQSRVTVDEARKLLDGNGASAKQSTWFCQSPNAAVTQRPNKNYHPGGLDYKRDLRRLACQP